MRAPLYATLALAAACTLAGCADTGSSGESAPRYSAPGDAAPLPATTPYLANATGSVAWAVWPSNGSWLLLRGTPSFAQVTNRTPVGVETNGGLVASVSPAREAVTVEAHERLLRSPVLMAISTGPWIPAELPDAVADARSAIAFRGADLTVVTRGGALLLRQGQGWSTLTTAHALRPGLHLDAVTWAGPTTGWLVGHGRAGASTAFVTTDAGASWRRVPATAGRAVAALPPCGTGERWTMPVVDTTGRIRVLRSVDTGATWTAGTPAAQSAGLPAWGCSGDEVWIAARSHGHDVVLASSDSGATWRQRGRAPHGLSDLTPTGHGLGLATGGGDTPTLWAVRGDGATFTPITLPSWVASAGSERGTH